MWSINDIPNISETYVHRIGRSLDEQGGRVISIPSLSRKDNEFVKDIAKSWINQRNRGIREQSFSPNRESRWRKKEKKETSEKGENEKEAGFFAARTKNRSGQQGRRWSKTIERG